MTAAFVDEFTYAGRQAQALWRPAPFMPPRGRVTQCSALCLSDDGLALLVSKDGQHWALPGGRPEAGESLEAALRREVREEVCAEIVDWRYLGCQEMHESMDDHDLPIYYQTRFWARVRLDAFVPRFEIVARCSVPLIDLPATLGWHESSILLHLIELVREIEGERAGA